jgi:hypothetical protein
MTASTVVGALFILAVVVVIARTVATHRRDTAAVRARYKAYQRGDLDARDLL